MEAFKVINVSGEDITFDSFDLTMGGAKELVWNAPGVSKATWGQMLTMHDMNMLEFVDEYGKQISESALAKYYVKSNDFPIDEDIEIDFDDNQLNYYNENDLMSF